MINEIPCVKCESMVTVDTEQYLKGETFSCKECGTSIGIDIATDVDAVKMNELKLFSKNRKVRETQVPCPDCGTAISFNNKDLKTGKSVTCLVCKASVSLIA
ncbi:hypothetical protein BST92_13545 [Nonlabens arenilitoris]|uniref:Uncharacterized protein n=1 Tax=Nonlabens arenilitoris TaxID=1217969 RepID=A0A2S7UE64_9FLAO|nr:hypothetical protein [Nonlabens arenilitoris]PQJ32881.1 hypothetical protein BST92_13545 [Nonlabens arenilitoris]